MQLLQAGGGPKVLAEGYKKVRAQSIRLASSLSPEDQQIQAFEYASPTKWHLAHTTWFFETFVLELAAENLGSAAKFQAFDPSFRVLFNSYYEGVGERFARSSRGVLSRPSLARVLDYRRTIDDAVLALLHRLADDAGAQLSLVAEICQRIELGLHHEQQHQELLLTDILANFSVHPLCPAWRERQEVSPPAPAPSKQFVAFDGGLVEAGCEGPGFHFDNEAPRHRVFLEPFALRVSHVTNGEVAAFIADGGYQRPELWLSDGIDWVRREGIEAPRYWQRSEAGSDDWHSHTLYGLQPLRADDPVTHVSGYEAEAIARWLGARLPTEYEWESAAAEVAGAPEDGRWLEDGPVQPSAAHARGDVLRGMWGECWEWTRSAYSPYPGFRASSGAVGEYNGKFMANQWVLRGGSCATPPGHIRPSYRNFFYPDQRWQFNGIRLARV